MTRSFTYGCLAVLVFAVAGCAVPADETVPDEVVDGDPGDQATKDEGLTEDSHSAHAPSADEHPARTSAALTSAERASVRDAIIKHGERHLGVPYKFGASTSSTNEFDCSTFVKHLFTTEAGVTLPRTANQQSQGGKPVSLSNLQKGDVVFFKSTSRPVPVDHVGIYAGNGQIIHTYRVGIGVTYSSWDHWKKHAVAARDFIGN